MTTTTSRARSSSTSSPLAAEWIVGDRANIELDIQAINAQSRDAAA